MQINLGSVVNDGTGNPLRTGGLVINQYGILNDKTVNAAFYKTASNTNEAAITLAIVAAALLGTGAAVWVPASMLPYNASLVTFNTAVRMTCESGDASSHNPRAYGAAGDGALTGGANGDLVALNAALSAAGASTTATTVTVPPGSYLVGPGAGAIPPTAGDYSVKIPSGVSVVLQAGAQIIRNFSGGAVVNATIRNSNIVTGNTDISIFGPGKVVTTNALNTGKNVAFAFVTRLRLDGFGILPTVEPADWAVYLQDCNQTIGSNLMIDSGSAVGSDGYHIEGGSNHLIDACWIRSGDDAVAIVQEGASSSFGTTNCSDVAVTNCVLDARTANPVRIHCYGNMTPSNRSITRVAISNCLCRGGPPNGGAIIVEDDTATGIVTDVTMNNCTIDAGTQTGDCATIKGAVRCSFSKIKVSNPSSRWTVDGCTDILLEDLEIYGTRGAGVQSVLIAPTVACTNVRIIGGHFKGATQVGVQVGTATIACTDFVMVGAIIEGCTNDGLYLFGMNRGIVKGNRITAGNYGIKIGTNGNYGMIHDNYLVNSGNTGINDAGALNDKRGNKFLVNAMRGQQALAAANPAATVATAEVQTGDTVRLSRLAAGGTLGHLSIGAIVNGVSFTIVSSGNLDTSTIAWEIIH